MHISYPPELPVSARREDIAAAIRDHQVVIVAGETGSGKTTQIPKICLELGLAEHGRIGHTQPRRIAARSVAERVASELGTELGDVVGYTVRFTDQVSGNTAVQLMTDGILLAQIQRDPLLRRYSVIIVDEAHERSLNIDFLLGYLRQLLPRRPDLKVIITSATIDSQRFSEHFGTHDAPAPVIEVSGRTYPVEIRYRPLDEKDPDEIAGVVDAVGELMRVGNGDILVFLSGEREIRDAADALRDDVVTSRLEVVPLYARLSAAEQHKVFAQHSSRRVVLATNVAETSLTVPGIHYVVDAGTARISRYSVRTKVQRLPIEPISQASARQRSGRSGRIADGVAIRLYSQEDFDARPEYTDPEILRTNLASVILQMAAVGLGDIESFPFLEAPDSRAIRDGKQLLVELGALSARDAAHPRLTRLGRRLARIPLDPRLARMVLEAERLGCVHEVLVIAAAMSIQDPRERPAESQARADQLHARFQHPQSDFLSWLNLWEYLRFQQKHLSSSAFRRLCREEHLHYLRVREWQDLHSQLKRVAKDLKLDATRSAGEPLQELPDDGSRIEVTVNGDAVHRALLTGLLSNIGAIEERESKSVRGRKPPREYLGARGIRFQIFPGSALARKPPAFVMAGELVETSRLWARQVGEIDPDWVIEAASHLVRRNYAEPHWSARRGSAMARESVQLYGVPLVADRLVNLGTIDPELARELFIRHALVEGDWRPPRGRLYEFLAANRRMISQAADLEHRARRRDLVIDDDSVFAFYSARIPASVTSATHFETWWRREKGSRPDLLTLTQDALLADEADSVDTASYPDTWTVGDIDLALAYRFDPGHDRDGVTVKVPAALMNQLPADAFEWNVPGLREELFTALIRSLPKSLRRHLAPAPDNARKALAVLEPGQGQLLPSLAQELSRLSGVTITPADFDWEKVPAHLRVRVEVTGDRGRTVASGKDLDQVGRASAGAVAKAITSVASEQGLHVGDVKVFPAQGIPQTFSASGLGGDVTGYPSLVVRELAQTLGGTRVDLDVLPTQGAARLAMPVATRELILNRLATAGSILPGRGLVRDLSPQESLALAASPYGSLDLLLADLNRAAADAIIARGGGAVWDATGFNALEQRVIADIREVDQAALTVVLRVFAAFRDAQTEIRRTSSVTLLPSLTDAQTHLNSLITPGFIRDAGVDRLPDVLRYVQAVQHRVSVLAENPQRDAKAMYDLSVAQRLYDDAVAAVRPGSAEAAELADVRWMLQEYRVSLFAQVIGTARPVSLQRIQKAVRKVQ